MFFFFSSAKKGMAVAAWVLLMEAVSRVIKNELNKMLRKKMNELKLPLEVRSIHVHP